jgi:hypothetical protein
MTTRAEDKPVSKDSPSRTDQAREVAKAYADDLREIIKKLSKKLQ